MERILLVDDDNIIRLFFTRLFESCKKCFDGEVKITTCPTIDEASVLVSSIKFDVVILDLTLDKSQEHTISMIPELSKFWPPIVVLTGDLDVDRKLRSRCILLGADDFCTKDIVSSKPEVLLEKCYHSYLRSSRSSYVLTSRI